MSEHNKNEGKLRPSLILRDMADAFEELLKVREMGCGKYDRLNWAEPLQKGEACTKEFLDDNLDSIERHLLAVERGELRDDETNLLHMAHVACRALFAVAYALRANSDRVPPVASDDSLRYGVAFYDLNTQREAELRQPKEA